MYNDGMAEKKILTLICNSCGLRYPFIEGQTFGMRCPLCMGETRVLRRRKMIAEPTPELTNPFPRGETRPASNNLAVLLDNIRSAWNVGSILRSADGFGFAQAYLCGITSTPDGQARDTVRKTSLGAEDSVPWSYHKDAVKLVRGLKKEGWSIFALEEDERASSISQFAGSENHNPVVIILGNEVTGVDPELLDLSDNIFHIPMRGGKKSFNVAIAFGIAAYAITLH